MYYNHDNLTNFVYISIGMQITVTVLLQFSLFQMSGNLTTSNSPATTAAEQLALFLEDELVDESSGTFPVDIFPS